MPRIVFTGGGTAGHVTPNLALIEQLSDEGWEVLYVGSGKGIENQIVGELGIPFRAIATGKLRRYFSWQNFLDPFRILTGFVQSLVICIGYRPNVVFSKGGFVAVPFVVAAWLCRIPVIGHESDMTPGLANKLCYPFVHRICVNFPQTANLLPAGKVVVTGTPIRKSLRNGDAQRGRDALGLSGNKPVLLIFGGSLGAATINGCVREILGPLTRRFDVVHVAGPGNIDPSLANTPGYIQREYLSREFGDLLAAADVVISRAGANSVYELLASRKPHILIPLPRAASRGDQIENAEVFQQAGMSRVILQEDLTSDKLLALVESTWDERSTLSARIADFEVLDSVAIITGLIRQTAR